MTHDMAYQYTTRSHYDRKGETRTYVLNGQKLRVILSNDPGDSHEPEILPYGLGVEFGAMVFFATKAARKAAIPIAILDELSIQFAGLVHAIKEYSA